MLRTHQQSHPGSVPTRTSAQHNRTAKSAVRRRTMRHSLFLVSSTVVLFASAFCAFGVPVLMERPIPKARTVAIEFRFLGKDYVLNGTLDPSVAGPVAKPSNGDRM
jgi:hypothetical protein